MMRMTRRLFPVLLSTMVLVLCVPGATAAPPEKLRALIVTGHDVGAHKWRETTEHTRRTLEASGKFAVKVSEDTGIFESSRLGQYDVIVLNYGFWTEPELSDEARKGLLDFVSSGKGLVSIHFSCSSFQEWDEYVNLLGRVWKKGVGGHGPRGKFDVKVTAPDHPIMKGLEDFEMDDELYAKLSGDVEIQTLASARSDWSKKVEPIVFVKSYGDGRVVHNVLGHDLRARETDVFETLLVRGTEWAATGKVSGEK